jgi:hypothetical protein
MARKQSFKSQLRFSNSANLQANLQSINSPTKNLRYLSYGMPFINFKDFHQSAIDILINKLF